MPEDADAYRPPDERVLSWVERSVGRGARVLGATRLVGGLTSDMDRLRVEVDSRPTGDLVLRRWTRADPWSDGLVVRESAALRALPADVPAPRLVASDGTGDDAGVRAVLTTALDGEPLLAPTDLNGWLGQLGELLVRIHRTEPGELAPTDPFGFHADADRSWIGDPGLERAVVAAASEAPPAIGPDAATPAADAVLAHGDYQHFNVLWTGERLCGVVDGTFCGAGVRELDVGHCRLNLAVLFSAETADDFLARYEARAGVRLDPRRDIRELLGYGPAWQDFIPLQVAGRASLDVSGMAGRVTQTLRTALTRLG